jgi:CubicO group peptidase (beta-lactamase class C family)
MTQPLPQTHRTVTTSIATGLHTGAQIYVSRCGGPVADFSVGEVPAVLPWLSAGKPIAAVALALLRERGQLDFDDPVTQFIPEFGKPAVTLRHLLTHTGGFRFMSRQWTTESWDEIVAEICAAPLDPGWIPGQKAGYHLESSWYILGEVVRRVTGQSYAEFVRSEVFQPLGMTNSTIPGSPGRSAVGPLRELGRFYEMLLRGGGSVLTAESVRQLAARHRVGMWDITFGMVIDWGLGFMLNTGYHTPYSYGPHASENTFGHGGRQSSLAFCDPDRQLVVAWACAGQPGEPAHQRRALAINTAIYEDLGFVA